MFLIQMDDVNSFAMNNIENFFDLEFGHNDYVSQIDIIIICVKIIYDIFVYHVTFS